MTPEDEEHGTLLLFPETEAKTSAETHPEAETQAEEPASSATPSFDYKNALVGEILQHERLALGLSIDDCFSQLRIRKVYLEALEAEDLQALPQSETIIRAYIASYAGMLELDAQPLLAQFSDRHYPNVEPTISRQPRPLPPLPTNKILFMVACILLLLLGVGLIQSYVNIEEEPVVTKTVIAPPPRKENVEPEPTAPAEAVSSAEASTPENPIAETPTAETPMVENPAPETLTTAQEAQPLQGIQILHDSPLWMTILNANGIGSRSRLQPGVPLEIEFGQGKEVIIDDFDEVIITVLSKSGTIAGEVPYGMMADRDGRIAVDRLM